MASDGTIKINTELDNSKAESAMSKFSSTAKTALKGVTVAAGAVGTAMAAMAGYSIKVGSDFEAGMSKVSAISGATGSDLEALSDKAKEMGASTKFSATEAASAFEYMAMAGWKTEDMLSGIEGIMNLAAASGEDLATTSDIVTDALTGFGLTAADSSHFADVLAAASSNANTNVSMMGETFKYVAPVAGALGFSAEDTAVAIGLMANSGIKAGQAGTALRAMLSRLTKPTDEVQDAMDRLGVSITNSDGSMKSLNEVMADLREGFSGLSEAESANLAASLAGQEAMSGLLAIVNASDADFNKLKDSIYNCDGATEKMAETMQDNLQGSVTIAKSAIEGFGIQIYEEMQEPLKEAVDTGTEYITRLSDAFASGGLKGVVKEAGEVFDDLTDRIAETSDEAEGVITPIKNVTKYMLEAGQKAIPVVVSGSGKLLKNFDKVASASVAAAAGIKTLKIAQNASEWFNKAATSTKAFYTALAANPIGLVVTGVAALTAGLVTYNIASDESLKKAYELTEGQKKSIDTLSEATEKMQEARQAREEAVQAIDAEYDGYEKLLSELRSITDENGNVKARYEDRARVIAEQLNQELGTEITVADGKIEKYQEVAAAIDEVIQKKKAEALLTSMQEDMNNAYKEAAEVSKDYQKALEARADAADKLKIANDNLTAAEVRLEKARESGVGESEAVTEYNEEKWALDDVQAAYDEATDSALGYERELENLSSEVNRYRELQEAVNEGDVARIEAAMEALISEYVPYTEEMLAASEKTRQEMYDGANEAVDTLRMIQEQGGEVYEAFGEDAARSVTDILNNFNQLPGGIAQGIEDIGPQASAAMLSALAQADLDGKLGEEGRAAVNSLISSFSGLDSETQEIFANAAYGALAGLEGFEDLKDPAEVGVEEFLESLRAALDEHSPSKKTEEIFQLAMEGAENGIESGKEGVLTKAGEFITEFLEKFSETSVGEKLQDIGSNVMSFFGLGVSSQKENSRLAGKENADAANSGAGSVNPSGTGSLFGTLFGGGIGGMLSFLFGQGKDLSDSANSGAGSVDSKPTGEKFGSDYASGVGNKSGDANSKGRTLSANAHVGASAYSGYDPGSNFGKGFVDGIAGWLGAAADAAAKLAISAYNALRKALDERSPSRKAKKSGKNFDLGFSRGINENKDYAISEAEKLSEETLNALDIDALYEKMKSIDVSAMMERINTAVEDKKAKVSDVVVAGVSAKEREKTLREHPGQAPEIDYKRLGKELSKRPVIVTVNTERKKIATLFADPIRQEQENTAKIKRMIGGEKV